MTFLSRLVPIYEKKHQSVSQFFHADIIIKRWLFMYFGYVPHYGSHWTFSFCFRIKAFGGGMSMSSAAEEDSVPEWRHRKKCSRVHTSCLLSRHRSHRPHHQTTGHPGRHLTKHPTQYRSVIQPKWLIRILQKKSMKSVDKELGPWLAKLAMLLIKIMRDGIVKLLLYKFLKKSQTL